MPDNSQSIPEENEESFGFPFFHLIAGLVLSAISFVALIALWANMAISFAHFIKVPDLSLMPGVLMAYLVPEIIIIGTLAMLARRSNKLGQRGYRASYNTLIIINIICFCFICTIMGSVSC